MSALDKSIREIRINPIIPTESVLVATSRGMRPKNAEAPAPRDTRTYVETCPFCKGNESMTPPAILSYPDSSDWSLRIVENLYPVLDDSVSNPDFNFGLQQTIDGYGRHEVMIDHVHHGIALHEMSVDHLQLLFSTYQERMLQLYRSNERLKYVLVFKNFGPAAGASIAHTHSQIIATPVVPHNVQTEIDHSHHYYNKFGKCIFCTMIDEALTFEATIYDRESGEIRRRIDVGQYIIEKGKHFVAVKPFASRFEWEVQIFPLVHRSDFLQASTEELQDLGQVLQRTMARLDAVLGGVQYNYFLHSIPHGDAYKHFNSSFHWHIEICPRTSIPTGFELGSGLFVNTVSPEFAAARLRDVILN